MGSRPEPFNPTAPIVTSAPSLSLNGETFGDALYAVSDVDLLADSIVTDDQDDEDGATS